MKRPATQLQDSTDDTAARIVIDHTVSHLDAELRWLESAASRFARSRKAARMNHPARACAALHKSFARTEALRGVSLDVQPGRGRGRHRALPAAGSRPCSTPSPACCCPRRASVVVRRAAARRARRGRPHARCDAARSGSCSSSAQLVPDLTAVQNVALPLLLDGTTGRTSRTAALAVAGAASVSAEVADQVPAELSGGESQRVAVARALVHRSSTRAAPTSRPARSTPSPGRSSSPSCSPRSATPARRCSW